MSRFMDAFGQDAYRSGNISAEVLNLLNSELPTNLMYFQDNDGRYMVIPRPENLGDELKLTTQLDLPDHLRERVKIGGNIFIDYNSRFLLKILKLEIQIN